MYLQPLFKNEFNFEDRLAEARRVLNNYPDRIPIICERSTTARVDCPIIDKRKYLVPRDLTIGQFLYVIRKRLQLDLVLNLIVVFGIICFSYLPLKVFQF